MDHEIYNMIELLDINIDVYEKYENIEAEVPNKDEYKKLINIPIPKLLVTEVNTSLSVNMNKRYGELLYLQKNCKRQKK